MKNIRLPHYVLGVTFLAMAFCMGAWAQTEVTTKSVSPSGQVTTTTETTPTSSSSQQMTATKSVSVRHEALMDADGNIVNRTTITKTAPPELKEEVKPIETRPSDNAVWVPGYWQWDTTKADYDWVPGTWRRAIPDMTWQAGRWEKVPDGYEWLPGYWSSESTASAQTTTTRTIVIGEAPPALKEESRPASPGADVVWVPGSWTSENDKYVWSPGRWERPAAEEMVWVPARWVQNSAGYARVPGRWDYPVASRTYVISESGTPR